jgi:serine/threonine protein kinase
MREHFRDEIRILGRLRHPNITTIIGAGSHPCTNPFNNNSSFIVVPQHKHFFPLLNVLIVTMLCSHTLHPMTFLNHTKNQCAGI